MSFVTQITYVIQIESDWSTNLQV